MRHLALLALAAGVLALGACATSGGGPGKGGATASWRKVTQVEHRFAVFIDEPGAPRQGDLVTFRLAYIYAPGEVFWKANPDEEGRGKEVEWQEYTAMTVNCATHEMKPGPRVRYAPGGAVLLSDDSQDFGEIVAATAAEDAARVWCAAAPAPAADPIRNGPKWLDAARRHLAETPPTARP